MRKIKNLGIFIILLLSSIMLIGSIYYQKEYPKQDFDQILYYLTNGVEHTAPSVVNSVIFSCIIPVILLCFLLYSFTISNVKRTMYLTLQIKKKKFKIQIYPIKSLAKHRGVYTLIIFLMAIIISILSFKIHIYIYNRMQETNIYEEYYVDARDVKMDFPEEKRNLIIIAVESLENTVLTKANGGAWEYSIIPELEQIAVDNLNFSHTDRIGGAKELYGTNFSVGGNVAMTSGVPLKTVDILKDKNTYKGNGKYLAGVFTLGEVLKEQGYNLEIMMGSDATFGGRADYFKTNGDYKIFDVNYAINQGKMTTAQKVWWGFEDDKLYKWSKEELIELAQKGSPFNYIMITADTHFVDGYLGPNVENKFGLQYENVHAYSSKSINEFIEWVKKQDFYENTTIVIIGDHLGMQTEFYELKADKNYERTIYNAIINSAIQTNNNKNRTFTTTDLYPTMLASIGVKIEGERLGLGTNLYSNVPTLAEKLGLEYFNIEVQKNSTFYNKELLGEDYYLIKKNTQQEMEGDNEKNNNNNTSI